MRGFFSNTTSTPAGGQPATGTDDTDKVARFPLRIALVALLLGTAVGALLTPESWGIDGEVGSGVNTGAGPATEPSPPTPLLEGEGSMKTSLL